VGELVENETYSGMQFKKLIPIPERKFITVTEIVTDNPISEVSFTEPFFVNELPMGIFSEYYYDVTIPPDAKIHLKKNLFGRNVYVGSNICLGEKKPISELDLSIYYDENELMELIKKNPLFVSNHLALDKKSVPITKAILSSDFSLIDGLEDRLKNPDLVKIFTDDELILLMEKEKEKERTNRSYSSWENMPNFESIANRISIRLESPSEKMLEYFRENGIKLREELLKLIPMGPMEHQPSSSCNF